MNSDLQAQSLLYVTTHNLGFSPVQERTIAEVMDVTCGDAAYTLVKADRFVQGVEDTYGLVRGGLVRDQLLALGGPYVAFIG